MSKLFTPARIGQLRLAHRVVLAPLTRLRTEEGDVPGDLMVEYYAQRASRGGLLIAEATSVSPMGIAYARGPGIHTDEQVAGWKKVTDAVHAKGASIYLQLWHGGRQAHPDNMNGELPVAPSAIAAKEKSVVRDGDGIAEADQVVPRALRLDEIPGVIEEYRRGAERAKAAGFDGVEVHGANGYLPDQFLQDGTNHRDDAYGGSIENRARFMLDVVEAAVSVWGGDRVAVRISPSGQFGTMSDSNPTATFGYLAKKLNPFGLAYLHVIEPRIRGYEDIELNVPAVASKGLRGIFEGPIIAAGGFTKETAEEIVASGDADLVAFGRPFISNPDLPERLRINAPLNPYDRNTFYGGRDAGYTDYAFLDEGAVA
ncbi:alkene reductase [Pseudomonas gingeri]|uniref:alkene reductase n=1 Tax=Pseudomonas gingeri TaxID=117681 RepID=UPI0015A36623|nr:alkene reductase [Pseudomonas gingeri]NVZ29218.1 alkene reductase [Pseudomonas gingeri]NWA08946.1 alkene reductase [Pseudomonas gingeri]